MGQSSEEKKGSREADPLIAAVLAWAVPGAGHLYLGKPAKALLFFVLIAGTFFTGLAVSGFTCVSYSQQPVWFVGQVFAGIPTVIIALVDPAKGRMDINETLDLGTLYTTVAALLNFLVLLNALNATREEEEEEGKEAGEEGGGA
jgi:TM2 domain-containing membrane protein YozV